MIPCWFDSSNSSYNVLSISTAWLSFGVFVNLDESYNIAFIFVRWADLSRITIPGLLPSFNMSNSILCILVHLVLRESMHQSYNWILVRKYGASLDLSDDWDVQGCKGLISRLCSAPFVYGLPVRSSPSRSEMENLYYTLTWVIRINSALGICFILSRNGFYQVTYIAFLLLEIWTINILIIFYHIITLITWVWDQVRKAEIRITDAILIRLTAIQTVKNHKLRNHLQIHNDVGSELSINSHLFPMLIYGWLSQILTPVL